ncbi:MAG: hypothetical protein RLZZ64_501, partial [Bacteroidota bacterium]
EIVKSYPQYFNQRIQKVLEKDEDPFGFPGLKFVKSVEESKLLNFRSEPCVIISASGMADAGRVKHHISNNIENSRNAILMTGYCEPHSLGAKLLSGRKEVNIYGVPHEVHAEIGGIRSMSAHGDYEDLSQYLSCQDPQKVKQLFLVHGEYNVQEDFKERLLRKGFVDVVVPELHQEIGLGEFTSYHRIRLRQSYHHQIHQNRRCCFHRCYGHHQVHCLLLATKEHLKSCGILFCYSDHHRHLF